MIFPSALKIRRINNLTSRDFKPIQSINGADLARTIGICPVVAFTYSHIAHPWSLLLWKRVFFLSTIVDLSRSTQCRFTKLNRHLIREWLTNPRNDCIPYRGSKSLLFYLLVLLSTSFARFKYCVKVCIKVFFGPVFSVYLHTFPSKT